MGFLGTKKAVTSAKVDTSKAVERGGSTMPDGTKVNVLVERCEYRDASQSQYQVEKQGKTACENAINIMLRITGHAEGKYIKKCLFHTCFLASDDPARAAKDQQILAMICSLAEEQDSNLAGITADVFDGDDWPAAEVLADLVGTNGGVTVGSFTPKGGTPSEFVRTIGQAFDFTAEAAGAAGAGAGATGSTGGRQRRRRD